MEKKNVVFLTVLAVATLLTAVVGTTFAYFTATVTNVTTPTATTVTTAKDLGITYDDGDQISMSNIIPGQYTDEKTIKVTNNSSTTPIDYKILWSNVVNSFVKGADSTTDDLVYSLVDETGANKVTKTGAVTNDYVATTLGSMSTYGATKAYSVAQTTVGSATFGQATIDAGTTSIIVGAVPAAGTTTDALVPTTTIQPNTTHTYKLRVYYLETGINQNENQSSSATVDRCLGYDAGTTPVPANQADCENANGTWTAGAAAKTVSFSATLKAEIVASSGIQGN